MKPSEIVIYAPNVHQGGGKTLLVPLLLELSDRREAVYILDERLDVSAFQGSATIIRVRASIWSRLKNEIKVRNIIRNTKSVLCMGNLPPLLAGNDDITVFIQNRYLVDKTIRCRLPLKVRTRLWLERVWLRLKCGRVRRFVVQTETMSKLFSTAYNRESDVIPFIPDDIGMNQSAEGSQKIYDYLYVASGEEHKNHKMLIAAWVELSRKGLYPELCLTVNRHRFPGLCSWIETETGIHGLRITNVGELRHDEIPALYQQSKALIYPSLFESFGLPLLDAVSLGVPVLVADRDYVHDIIKDAITFDPTSSVSIANAVSGFGFEQSKLAIDPCSARQFIEKILVGSAL